MGKDNKPIFENILSAVKRASKHQHNSYYWQNEWEWIKDSIKEVEQAHREKQNEIDALKAQLDSAKEIIEECGMHLDIRQIRTLEKIVKWLNSLKGDK